MIGPAERDRMLNVPLVGERVVMRLEGIGVTGLDDLRDADPHELVSRVNLAAGRPIWSAPMATRAMANLIAAARG
ncbi:MAG TPA: hypothetical protein VNB64_06520 [Solirubrobacteraceae bacterium]|nr:hypothetical protein [Solirubrobacteraceae bacterium]